MFERPPPILLEAQRRFTRAPSRAPLLPTYLISGDEPLIAGEAADAIRNRARAQGFSEREVFFQERGADWEAVRTATHTLSLFASRRIIEVRLPSGKPGTSGAREFTRASSSHSGRIRFF